LDSSFDLLLKVFWVQVDQVKRWTAKRPQSSGSNLSRRT